MCVPEWMGAGLLDCRFAPAVANVVEAIIAHEDGRNVIGGGLAERHLSVLY